MKELVFEKNALSNRINDYWKELGRWQIMVLIINIATLAVASYFFNNKTIVYGVVLVVSFGVILLGLFFRPQYHYSMESSIIAFAVSSPPTIVVAVMFFYEVIIEWYRIGDFQPKIELFFFVIIIIASYLIKITVKECLSTLKYCAKKDKESYHSLKTKGSIVWLSAFLQTTILTIILISVIVY